MSCTLDPQVVARAILANAQKHFVYGNGLMNVFIFEKLFGTSFQVVRGYLNVKTPDQSVSVRHFYIQLPDGEILDPTFFTQKMIENELSNTTEPSYDHELTDEESRRDAFFDQLHTNSNGYWLLTHKKCVDVYKDVLKDLQLRLEDFPIPMRKLAVNDMCPCGSGNKFKRCHANQGALQ